MSGFVCVVRTDGAPIDPALLTQVSAPLRLRGPDGSAMRCLGHVGLACTHLAIGTATNRDAQPLTLDGRSWIVADARIDGRDWRTSGDAEHLLRAYASEADGCVERILGDFAFAIWDDPARRLLCATDHFGIRPLFYAHTGSWLIVSNAVAAVRALPGIPDELDEAAVADFLLFAHKSDPAATTFRAIRKLPPGHRLTWSETGGLQVTRYWQLPVEDPVYMRDEAYAEQLRALVDAAVADRVRGSRVSILYSGGLDSNVLATTALRLAGSSAPVNVEAFTFVHDRLIDDEEGDAAEAAARALRLRWTRCALDTPDNWDGLTSAATPEPFVGPIDVDAARRCYARVAAHSRVVLDGEGPDNALLYEWRPYLRQLRRSRRWGRIARDACGFVKHRRRLPRLRSWMSRDHHAAPLAEAGIPTWMSRDLVERLRLRERWDFVMRDAVSGHPWHPAGWFSFQMPIVQAMFEEYDPDNTGVPFAAAFPFFDLRVLRFLLRVPVIPWCADKQLLRFAYRDDLPRAVTRRPKTPLRGSPTFAKARRARLPAAEPSPTLERFGSVREVGLAAGSPSEVDAALRFVALSRWLACLASPSAAAG